MQVHIINSLLAACLLFAGFSSQVAYAAESGDHLITVYVVPTMTDEKILPTTTIPDSYISNEISITASPGEYEPASFVIKALDDIVSLELEVNDLEGAADFIPSSNIDVRVVKCWYQAGYSYLDTTHKHLTSELLLKDDSIVKVEGGENYLKMLDGTYMWISDPTPAIDRYKKWSIDEISVQDSPDLQPVDIPAGTNKQFWITLKVPDGISPGTYTGNIELSTPTVTLGSIGLRLEVLPIELLKPYLEYSIYYTGRISNSYRNGTISSSYKSEQQLRAELIDMREHGISNPTVYQGFGQDPIDTNSLGRYLAIRDEVGMSNQPLYYISNESREPTDPTIVPAILSTAQSYGIPDVYFYGEDECLGHLLDGTAQETVDRCLEQRPVFEQIHALGGKIFVAGMRAGAKSDARSVGEFGLIGDLVDLFVCYGPPYSEEAALWHSVGHRIFNYANPVVGEEEPEKYRRNYGLLLWQGDYDGTMPWGYNYHWGNPWNDFDDPGHRGSMFGYPTINGVIGTIQWEGWREGVDDIRYLTTLLKAFEMAKAEGRDTSSAESWLAGLKSSDLSNRNLNTIRSEIIGHILSLTNSSTTNPPTTNSPPVLNYIGNKTVATGELLQFTVSAVDPDGDNLSYSALNLPDGASFDKNTHVLSWTPTENQAEVYSNIKIVVTDGNLSDAQNITINVISSSPSPGGTPAPSGGGGGFETTPGVTYVSDYVGTSGIFIKDIIAHSEDGKAILNIPKGTEGKTKQGEALWQITMFKMLEPPDPPVNASVIGLIYDIKPDGATFDQPVTITITYDPSIIPEGVNEEDLAILCWDDDTNQWIKLEGTSIDLTTHRITTQITHFSIYTVTAEISSATFELSSLSIAPSELEIGEEVVISTQVTNTGGQVGDYYAKLKINDVIESTKKVTVQPGGTEEVRFSQTKNMVGIYTVEIDGLIGSFEFREPQTTQISILDITPNYLMDTHDLNFVRIIYEVRDHPEIMTNGELVLCIDYNGQPLELIPELPISLIERSMILGDITYTPPQGWENGIYSFRTELYIGGELRTTSLDEKFEVTTQPTLLYEGFEATSQSATPIYNWGILGEMIGTSLFISVLITLVILIRRHHLIKSYTRYKI